ncbi:MAG: serine/threonine protein kinase [Gammaproteobacteria bacterium]
MEAQHFQPGQTFAGVPTRLKRDAFGTINLDPATGLVVRDTSAAMPALRWLARALARREARALRRLAGRAGFPEVVTTTRTRLGRTYLVGAPMHEARFDPRRYFPRALRQLRRMHAHGVTHNDLAKEANWICGPGDEAGIVDFQIAGCFTRRSALFRLLAREDLRHLLKHKRHYAPELLSPRQKRILANPAWTAKIWRIAFKPPYLFVTRRLLGWQERHCAAERSI